MFKFIILILAFMVSARAELPPTRAAGQGETLKPAFNLYFPPSTVSDMGGINKFIDTGSENLLVNSGFEAQTVSSGWTISNATTSAGTAFKGLKSLSLSLTGLLSLSQEITATQYYPNVVSFSLWVKSSITDIQLCSTLATVEQECVDYDGSDQWKKLQVLVTAHSSGAMGLKLKTLSTTSGTILVDNGEFSSNPLKQDVSIQTQSLKFASASNGFASTWTNNKKFSGSPTQEGDNGLVRFVNDATFGDYFEILREGAVVVSWGGIYYNTSSGTCLITLNQSASSPPAIERISGSAQSHAVATLPISITGNSYVKAGDKIRFLCEAGNYNGAGETISLTVVSKSPNIITANDVVSSETINWQFKSTAITDSDPVGTYNTYYFATGSSNIYTLCGTAPSVLPNGSDGFLMYARGSGTNTTTCNNPARVVVKLGKGLKGHQIEAYKSTNKSGDQLNTDWNYASGGGEIGIENNYSQSTGLLTMDIAKLLGSFSNLRCVVPITQDTACYYNPIYIHFAASKNPVISALDAVPRIDYSWENRFDLIIAGATETSSCTSDPCVIYGDSQDIATAANRSTTGRYTVTLDSSKIASYPFVEVSVTGDTVSCSASMTAAHTVGIACDRPAPTNSDTRFKLTITRRSDYRSRGDAAAIISSPVCYIRELSTDNPAASANTVHVRGLNSMSGACSGYSLSSNQLTIPAGTYIADFCGYSYRIDYSSVSLYNVTDSSYFDTHGVGDFNWPSDAQARPVCSNSYFTITGTKTIELRHWTAGADADGLGNNGVTGNNPATTNMHSWIKLQRVK